jgi:hypothetical protein
MERNWLCAIGLHRWRFYADLSGEYFKRCTRIGCPVDKHARHTSTKKVNNEY